MAQTLSLLMGGGWEWAPRWLWESTGGGFEKSVAAASQGHGAGRGKAPETQVLGAWSTPAPTFPFVREMEMSLDCVSPITCIATVAHLILSTSAFHHSVPEEVVLVLPLGWNTDCFSRGPRFDSQHPH